MILELFRKFLIHLNTETSGFSNKFSKNDFCLSLFIILFMFTHNSSSKNGHKTT